MCCQSVPPSPWQDFQGFWQHAPNRCISFVVAQVPPVPSHSPPCSQGGGWAGHPLLCPGKVWPAMAACHLHKGGGFFPFFSYLFFRCAFFRPCLWCVIILHVCSLEGQCQTRDSITNNLVFSLFLKREAGVAMRGGRGATGQQNTQLNLVPKQQQEKNQKE